MPTVFTKNRDRLWDGDIAEQFFQAVLTQARVADLLSVEHFSVDGTLIEAHQPHQSAMSDFVLVGLILYATTRTDLGESVRLRDYITLVIHWRDCLGAPQARIGA